MAAILVVFFLATVAVPVDAFTAGNETALRRAMFDDYDIWVRPADVTTVIMSFVPTSLTEINIKSQTMIITGWWDMHWNDSRLDWDPSLYDGVSETHVFEHDVWVPTVVVRNSVNSLSAIDDKTIPLRVSSTGEVEWSPPAILTVSCATDITYFPFDTQTCPVAVTTFGYTIYQVTVEPLEVDTRYYHAHGEWDLMSVHTDSEPDEYSLVSFSFVFKRKPAFYGLNFMMPVLMCWFLSVCIFLLPAQSGEKVGYSLTVLLAFVVLMSILSGQMPTTADHVSFLEVYIILVMAFCALSVTYSIINVAVYFQEESKPVPGWLRRFTHFNRDFCSCSRRSDKVSDIVVNAGRNVIDLTAPLSKEDRKPSIKVAYMDTAAGSNAGDKVTWSDVAKEMDSFMFKLYLFVTSALCAVLWTVMATNE